MKNYKISVKLKISTTENYNEHVVGESEIGKTVLLPACKVKDEATKLVRNAVAHFSESATLGLSPSIESEPKLDAPEPETLTV